MLSVSELQGAIFDVDETLLDTGVADLANSIHERSRRQAILEVAKRRNIPALLDLSIEQNLRDFFEAPTHSLHGAIWQTMYRTGVVPSDEVDSSNPLLREMADRKNELYEVLLRAEGKPFPGAIDFVKWLAAHGLADHLAIASAAPRRQIEIFLDIANLRTYFPDKRIIAFEDLTHSKPHPEAFDKAFLTLKLPDSARPQVLAFEDNPRGIRSAKDAGLFTCAITTVHSAQELRSQPAAPDCIADTFDEFRKLLTRP